jgi:putative mRNA 3-end processing factor
MTILKFSNKGIYCIPGDFYIDPWKPVQRAVITHGHADHAKGGMVKYLCHHFTKPILYARLGAEIQCESLGYGETLRINGVNVSFHPAGHIIGSAQIRMEYKGFVSVVSGDYKIQNDGLSTPFEPVMCHEFVSESTFGLPIYRWLSVNEQEEQMKRWVETNRKNHKTSVFIGYSLGKSQRIMQALKDVEELHVHYSIARLNEAYAQAGVRLPKYQVADLREDKKKLGGKIVLLPPALIDNPTLKKIPNLAYAICSGWMQVRGARRWRSADAGFAISDHADWEGLISAVKATKAEKVYVTHGQTAVFSKYLNEKGISSEEVITEYGEEEENE